ncbi:MAG: transcriptional regulator [Rhizobiales bacterium]|nr:transcriptional regulator [Hyphomicrobiales bacterium]
MVGLSRIRRAGLMAAAGLAALTLASCSDYVGKIPKHLAPLDPDTRALVEKKGMDQKAPILIRIFKEEASLEVWKLQKATGRYALLKDYDICAWSGELGPKFKEGDRQAPEGFYTIRPAQMNPNSSYHLSFNMGYPNEYDRAHGRTGSELMVHGACSSRGCYSMQDEQIQEIYTLGRLAFEGGQRDFQVQAFPFHMTAENMAKHRDNPHVPFWRMLKEGYDHFDLVRRPPKVDVCDRRYVFNSVPADGGAFSASNACPPLMMPDDIRVAVAKKESEDDRNMLKIAARLDRKAGSASDSMLAQALAAPTTAALAAPMSVAAAPVSLEPATVSSIGVAAVAAAPAGAELPAPRRGAASSIASVEPSAVNGEAPADLEPAIAEPDASRPTVTVPVPAAASAASAEKSAAPAPDLEAPAAATARATDPQIPAFAAASPVTKPIAPANLFAPPDGAPTAEPQSPTPVAPEPPAGASPAAEPAPVEVAKETTPAEPEQATLDERIQADGAAPKTGVASAYAPEPEADEGLTGFVLRLFE